MDEQDAWLRALKRGLDPLAWWAAHTGYGAYRQGRRVRAAIELREGRDSNGLARSLHAHGAAVAPLHAGVLLGQGEACITALVPLDRLRDLAALPGIARIVPGFIGGPGPGSRSGPDLMLRLLRASPAERAALLHRLRRAQAHGPSRRVRDLPEVRAVKIRRRRDPADRPLIGIVDFGCAFLHPALSRDPSGSSPGTRVLALWDQGRSADRARTGPPSSPWVRNDRAGYGRVATRERLDALAAAAVAHAGETVGRVSGDDWRAHELAYALAGMPELLQPGSHGTAVSALTAAGNDADILFVQLPQDAIDDLSGGWLTAYLVDALAWLEEQAGDRPMVVNLSVGTHAGPHDGSSLLERELERVAARRAVVLAAGNAAGRRGHATATLGQTESAALHWVLPTADPTQSFLDVWYEQAEGQPAPRFDFGHGTGAVVASAGSAGPLTLLRDASGMLAAAVAHIPPAEGSRSGRLWIALAPTHPAQLEPGPGAQGEPASAPPGTWRLQVHNPGQAELVLHAWIERDEPGAQPLSGRPDSVLVAPAGSAWRIDDAGTLTAQASARGVIAVGGTVRGAGTRLPESGQGPTRDGRPGVARWADADERLRGLDRGLPVVGNHSGPDAVAPTQGLRWRGTSLAAPQVVAQIARRLEQGAALGGSAPAQAALGPMATPPEDRSA